MTRFDRRALFATGAAAALLAATGVSLEAAPRRGGHLRIAVPRTGEGLGPVALAAVFETLTELTPEGVLRGRLATHWHGSSDGLEWDLTVRPGVEFHNGQALGAEDVATSLEVAPIGLPGLRNIQVIDPLRIRLRLADSDPHLPIRLAQADCVIRPAGDTGSGLVGSGLYAVRHAATGGGMTAARVENHYFAELAGWADRVDVVTMSDPDVRAEALAQGLVEAAVFLNAKEANSAAGLRCYPQTGGPALVLTERIGCPGPTAGLDTRIAERFWLT